MNDELIEPTQDIDPMPVETLYPIRDETTINSQNIEYPKPAYQEVTANTNIQIDPALVIQQNKLLKMQMEQMQMQQMQFQQMMLTQMVQQQSQVQQVSQVQTPIIIKNTNIQQSYTVRKYRGVPCSVAFLVFLFNLFLPGIGTMIGSCYVEDTGSYCCRGILELLLTCIIIGWFMAFKSSIDFCQMT